MKHLIACIPPIILGLVACATPVEPTIVGIDQMLPTAPVLPTATSLPTSTPEATPTPTEAARNFITYRHVSGVFTINIPDDWEVLDESTGQRLLLRLLPPMGFGSRVTIDITNEGPLSPQEVRSLAESYIHLNYVGNPAYLEMGRSDLADGGVQAIFRYDNGQGAVGQESLVIRQAGPYLTALRVFLADKDVYHLRLALESMAASFSVDPLAVWGNRVAAINPAELLLINTTLWRDKSGLTYYMGEVYNTSPSEIAAVQVQIAFCNEAGVVLAEASQPAALREIEQGGTSPFAVMVEGLPATATVCIEQASANPSSPDSPHTTALLLEPAVDVVKDKLVVRGRVSNPTLATVHNLEVILVIYSADGRVIGCQTLTFGTRGWLEPGQSLTFEHTFAALGGEPSRFVALGQADVFFPTDPSLIPTAAAP